MINSLGESIKKIASDDYESSLSRFRFIGFHLFYSSLATQHMNQHQKLSTHSTSNYSNTNHYGEYKTGIC
jgi:hypothetical protein